MYFSGDVSHNPTNDFRDRIVTELDQHSVETVSQCIDERNYLTICDLSASDINSSILHALKNGMYVIVLAFALHFKLHCLFLNLVVLCASDNSGYVLQSLTSLPHSWLESKLLLVVLVHTVVGCFCSWKKWTSEVSSGLEQDWLC